MYMYMQLVDGETLHVQCTVAGNVYDTVLCSISVYISMNEFILYARYLTI